MNQDAEHLNLLSIFHYIMGALTLLCAVYILIKTSFCYLLGSAMGPEPQFGQIQTDDPFSGISSVMFSYFKVYLALTIITFVLGICEIVAGRKIKCCKSRTFCRVIAGINCIILPIGTVLGVFTYVVLNRPSIRALFIPKEKVYGIDGTT